jgi:hypothetical protein
MDMLGFLGYGIAGFAVAVVLTLLYSLFRPIKKHDEILSWRVLAVLYVITLFVPYGYIEAMTKFYGAPLKDAVAETSFDATKEDSKLLYYKVLKCDGEKARVIAVNRERSFWGGFERSVMAINLEKSNGKWEAVEFNWVTSDQRNKDSVTLPPYW